MTLDLIAIHFARAIAIMMEIARESCFVSSAASSPRCQAVMGKDGGAMIIVSYLWLRNQLLAPIPRWVCIIPLLENEIFLFNTVYHKNNTCKIPFRPYPIADELHILGQTPNPTKQPTASPVTDSGTNAPTTSPSKAPTNPPTEPVSVLYHLCCIDDMLFRNSTRE